MRIPGLLLSITVFSVGFALTVPRVSAQHRNAPRAQPANVPLPEGENPGQTSVLLEIEAAVRADPKKAAAIVVRFLNEQPFSIKFTGQAVAASIRGLGQQAKRVPVGRIILAVVKARPAAVLEIMRVAVRQTRRDIHQEIVAAAASGVAAASDPYMPISVILVESGALGFEPYQSTLGDGPVEVVDGFKFTQGATLAEDIVQVAFQVALQSGSHESVVSLTNSANSVLQRHFGVDPFASVGQLPLTPFTTTPTNATTQGATGGSAPGATPGAVSP